MCATAPSAPSFINSSSNTTPRSRRIWRRRGGRHAPTADPEERTPAERRAAMTWAQRLKRVFEIDIETCPACGGVVRIIACIEDPEVIEKILARLDAKASEPEARLRPPSRAPPQRGLFDETG